MEQSWKVIVRLGEVLNIGGMVAVGSLAILVSYSAISRYAVNRAVFFAEELAGLLLVACAFLSFAFVFNKGGHIKLTLVTDRLPIRARYCLEIVTSVLALLYLTIFLKESCVFTYTSYLLGCHSNDAGLYEVPWMVLMSIGTLVFILSVLMFCLGRVKKIRGY